LLVVGNTGRGALAGAVTGSVALRCAHHARCPIVLVPAPTAPTTTDPRQPDPDRADDGRRDEGT
jgi:predicted dienelactone hydrolase